MAPPNSALQTPTDLPKASPEPRVFVMPERYRGGAAGLAMAEPKKEDPKPAPVVARPPAPLPPKPQPPKPVAHPAHGKPKSKAFVLIGIFLFLAVGIGGFFAFRTLVQPAASTATPVPVTETPGTAETSTPTTPVATEPTPTETNPFPSGTRPGPDGDSDGLSDLEERLLYSSDPGLPDTDGDGFLDGNEVFHGYNPTQPSPSTLMDAGLLKTYAVNAAPGEILYSIPYPASWAVTPSADDPRDAVFALTTGETLTVSVEDKTDAAQTLDVWYAAQNQTVTVRPATTKSGIKTLQTEDGLTAYVDRGVSVLIFHFDPGIKGTVDYLQTFKMILNGLALK